jgi:hypothetical protein
MIAIAFLAVFSITTLRRIEARGNARDATERAPLILGEEDRERGGAMSDDGY